MSRHKMVKNMDLDDELDDYDGDGYYEDGGSVGQQELSEEDQEQMRTGTAAVRDILGADVPDVTDKEIQESLWHYYYDVGKTVDYILSVRARRGAPPATKKKKKKENGGYTFFLDDTEDPYSTSLTSHLDTRRDTLPLADDEAAGITRTTASVPSGFFDDMPWLGTPIERQAMFIEPVYLRGGLLGGAPEAAPKMSKLQALAAARKKKAQEEKARNDTQAVDQPMADLSISETNNAGPMSTPEPEQAETPTKEKPRTYASLKRKNSGRESQRQAPPPVELVQTEPSTPEPALSPLPEAESAPPSAFASTMLHIAEPQKQPPPLVNLFTLPYLAQPLGQTTDAFAGPSPDDVVLAAQSKASATKAAKPAGKTAAEKKSDNITNGVEALKIDDAPRATSKNLDVLAEHGKRKEKNSANFIVIGHVDAGKSTLMGRLLYDLKVVDQRTIDKYKREAEKMGKSSFALAWVLDQGSEERSRGVTIDIATNKFETEKTAFTILDAPGHRDFIPNMLGGASQADFAVLVIDASTNAFEAGLRGQTKEHALLVRSMGVQRLIIAVNKLDTVSWSHDRFTEISQQISAFLTAAGFQSKNLSFIPCSGLHGDNIVSRGTHPAASWYTGPTLVEELDHSEPFTRALEKPLRLTINDIFRGGVQNPLSISGRIEAGSLQTGDSLIALPAAQKCHIKSLEIDADPTPRDWAVAGQNVVLHLGGIDPAHLKVGDVLCRPGKEQIPVVKEIKVKLLAFEVLTPMAVDVHRGRLHAAGRIAEFAGLLDKATGTVTRKRPRVVKPGEVVRCVVNLGGETGMGGSGSGWPLERGQRVVLRSGGETVGAGLIE